MRTVGTKPAAIKEYIILFPDHIQTILNNLHTTIINAAPGATEAIKYGMPTYVLEGNLVHFAAFWHHIGFYGLPSLGIEPFEKELSGYKRGKGSVQFPITQPVPLHLITQLVKLRIAENLKQIS